ncbi:MAG: ABC transporter permease [Eubacteriales bacterium]|nr:ABC transporter permease [Eubacteriales bacterium]
MHKQKLIKLIKRVLITFLSIALLSLIVFYISRLAPGDPLVSYFGERAQKLTAEERSLALSKLGLDQPIAVQYIRWLQHALQGDFGISYKYKIPVTELISDRIGNTLILGGLGFIIIFFGALILGCFCAWHEDKLTDRVICTFGTVLGCIPEFWLSLIFILIFAVTLRVLPSSGAYSIGGGDIADRIRHLIMPLSVVVIDHLWYYSYMVRNKLVSEFRADYVLCARAKGLSKAQIITRHCLRNIMPSYLSIMAVAVPHIIGGTYIVESVFAYPGLGTLIYESARYKDYNLLMLLCIMTGAAVIVCGELAKFINERIDPRLRKSMRFTEDEEVDEL